MCKAAFLDVDQFTRQILLDVFCSTQQIMHAYHKKDESSRYPVLIWNYMPPSAGSIIHPHVQMLLETDPVAELKRIKKCASKFFAKHKKNYWNVLVEEEIKLKERIVGVNDSVIAMTPFACIGYNEVQFIVPGAKSIADLAEKQVSDFVDALVKVLKGYKEIGVGSFNMASFSGPIGDKSEDYTLFFKLFSRPYPSALYTNDTGPFERAYATFVIDLFPEQLATMLRSHWT